MSKKPRVIRADPTEVVLVNPNKFYPDITVSLRNDGGGPFIVITTEDTKTGAVQTIALESEEFEAVIPVVRKILRAAKRRDRGVSK